MMYFTKGVAVISAVCTGAVCSAADDSARPYALEVGFVANLAATDIVKNESIGSFKLHTMGVDLTGVYARDAHHAFTLRLGYAQGEASESAMVGDGYYEVEGKLSSFYVMPGYRYTMPISEHWSSHLGVNVGLICHSAEEKETWDDQSWVKVRDSAYGVAGSIELGLTYKRSERISYAIAYQFSGSTARPKLKWSDGEATYSTTLRAQVYHTFRVGMSYHF